MYRSPYRGWMGRTGIEWPFPFPLPEVCSERGVLFPSSLWRWRQISLCFWQIGFLFSITKSPNWKRKPWFENPLCFHTSLLSYLCFFTSSSLKSIYGKWDSPNVSHWNNDNHHWIGMTLQVGTDKCIQNHRQKTVFTTSLTFSPIVCFQ